MWQCGSVAVWQSVLCVVAASADFTEHKHIAQSASAWVKSSADFTENAHTHTFGPSFKCLPNTHYCVAVVPSLH